jgi:hypothetical protein
MWLEISHLIYNSEPCYTSSERDLKVLSSEPRNCYIIECLSGKYNNFPEWTQPWIHRSQSIMCYSCCCFCSWRTVTQLASILNTERFNGNLDKLHSFFFSYLGRKVAGDASWLHNNQHHSHYTCWLLLDRAFFPSWGLHHKYWHQSAWYSDIDHHCGTSIWGDRLCSDNSKEIGGTQTN